MRSAPTTDHDRVGNYPTEGSPFRAYELRFELGDPEREKKIVGSLGDEAGGGACIPCTMMAERRPSGQRKPGATLLDTC